MLLPHGSFVLLVVLVTLVGCSPEPETERLRRTIGATYDAETGRLTEITYDSNDDGNIDIWTYMDGPRVLREEIDLDHDGKLDRWEYYDEDGTIEKVGMSSANDGSPDAWIFLDDSGEIARVELSTRRDGVIDRWEWYEQGVLVRAEGDGDGDGRPDSWDTYRDGRVTSAAFDEDGDGMQDRRLSYGVQGQLVTIERFFVAQAATTETIEVER